MPRYLLLLPLLALQGAAHMDPVPAKDQEPGMLFGPPAPKRLAPMSSLDAATLALQDAQSLNPYERPFIRYLFVRDGKFKNANIALNVISRAGGEPVKAVPLADGRLLRVYAKHYARFRPNSEDAHNRDINDFLRVWEELKYDPAFALLVTKDNAKFAGQKAVTTRKIKKKRVVDCPRYRAENGRLRDWKWEEYEVKEQKEFDVLRLNPDYLDPALSQLQKLLYTEAPIVHDGYFQARALHTVKNDGDKKDRVFATVWGGLYYEFRGIKRANAEQRAKGITDEDLFYRQFGIDDVEKLFDQMPSDKRAVLWKSEVTGKKRRVDFFNTSSGGAWDMMGIGSVTHDLNDKDIDVATNPIMNLLKFRDSAREAIFVSPNGMHAYAIFDGQGKLLDEADINAVTDRTVPAPHTPKLQCALSCMSCHEASGNDGWIDVKNDVKTMLGNRMDPLTGRPMPRVDIVADLGAKDQIGAINRIAGLYTGDFRKGIMRGRNDYAETILKASGPQGDNQLNIVKTAVGAVVEQTRTYVYGRGGNGVDARQALWELGVDPGDDPVKTLEAMLPPEPFAGGLPPVEDPRVAALKMGLAIPRTDFAFTFSYMVSRVHKDKGAKK